MRTPTRCAHVSSSALDRYDITGALEEIWVAVRRLNQYVEESAPWQLAKDDARADELDGVLYNLADGLRAIAVAVSRVPAGERAAHPRGARPARDDLSLERVRRGTAVAGRRHRAVAAALPAHRAPGRRRRDRHPRAPRRVRGAGGRRSSSARARPASTRIVSVGTSDRSWRETLEIAERHDGVVAALGIHPHEAADGDVRLAAPRRARTPEGRRRGGDRPRLLPRLRAARRAARALRRAARSSPPSSASPWSSTRARPTRTRSTRSPASTARSCCTASRRCRCSSLRSSAAGTSRSPATSRTRTRTTSASAAYAGPAERLLAETDSPYLAPVPRRGRPNEPANVVHTVAALAHARNAEADELAAQIDANAMRCFGL